MPTDLRTLFNHWEELAESESGCRYPTKKVPVANARLGKFGGVQEAHTSADTEQG